MDYPKFVSLKSYTSSNIDEKIKSKISYIQTHNIIDVVNDVNTLRQLANDFNVLADLYDTRAIMNFHNLYKQYEGDDKPCDFETYVETFRSED